ncbi:DUF3016 domain-containing protein [Psychrobium sp. MM17-31]|uniref:DUF3016 domain-containing protein n=1 Tax=Psychrobium sp. MM17-31 TaxID=2917758 RepID=UPI001EF51F28|nr:DUF3016 domain-containing protein [Psychrobium sp. MM17-31]MCG7531296.1 DUF3016 domain-containing protein [Psychrobium sp. MM17-31]
MKKLSTLIATALFCLSAQAAEVKVEFVKKEQFKDIDSGANQSQARFEEKLFSVLESTFKKQGEKQLPKDMTLDVSVLDIDLAGHVARGLGMGQDIRQVSDKDFPRILFYMILRDKNNNIVFQGRQNLKNNDMKHGEFRMKGSQSDFYMETMLIDKWFDQALVPAVNRL